MTEEIQRMIKERASILKELTITTAIMASFNDEKSPILMVIFDSIKLEFLIVSKSSKLILGYDSEEMANTKLSDYLLSEDLKAAIIKSDQNLIKGDQVKGFVNYYIHKNGKEKRKMTWFNTIHNKQKVFAVALPGELIKIENGES